MKYKLTMIIPIYNVQEYIKECLDSIFSQITDDVEIILINDGTPDKSVDIIKSKYSEWLKRDQVVLIEQENSGPGAARNSGLKIARGEYIGFLDSDDILLNNYFSNILDIINNNKIDIIEFGFKRFWELNDINKNDTYKPLYKFNGLYDLSDIRDIIFSVGVWYPWIRIFKAKIFKDYKFPEGVFYEDFILISQIYLNNFKIYFFDKPLIGYRYNPNSTTSLHKPSHAIDIYNFFKSLEKYEDSIPLKILKIKIARTLAYFYNELGYLDFPIQNIFDDIQKIKKDYKLLKVIKLPDMFFFLLPKTYMLIDKIRLSKKKGKK